MTFTLKWLILACILTQMLNSFFSQFEQDFVIKHFANCLIVRPIHICASHVCYGLRTYMSFPPPQCVLTLSPRSSPRPKTLLCCGVTRQSMFYHLSTNQGEITCGRWVSLFSIWIGMQCSDLKNQNKKTNVNLLCQYCRLTLRKKQKMCSR